MKAEAGLKDRLVSCATAMVAESGPENVTLRAIARSAGVSHGAPLRHFAGREALLSAVAAQGFRDLAARGRRVLAGLPPTYDSGQRLQAACHAYVAFAFDEPGMFALMFRHDLVDPREPELARVSLEVFDTLVELVRAHQSTGWQHRTDSRRLAGALWSALHGFAQLWIWNALPTATGAATPDAVLEVLLRAFDLPAVGGVGDA
ncbi:TetR/AcrR family transcriptional regulator [Nonomuraea sp. NPDC049419]|uniref:TetR/AcrR family transcriptional regulator n=1 Tax=Nonomuraea sp. NPDC049419 TaxID=3155772 RepID=UPI00343744B6